MQESPGLLCVEILSHLQTSKNSSYQYEGRSSSFFYALRKNTIATKWQLAAMLIIRCQTRW